MTFPLSTLNDGVGVDAVADWNPLINGANDLDDRVTVLESAATVRVGQSSVTTSSAAVTAETQVQTVSATLESGVVYQISWYPVVTGSVADAITGLRIRENNVGGTILQDIQPGHYAASRRITVPVIALYTAVSSASKTFSMTLRQALNGTHTLVAASTNPVYAFIDKVAV